MPPTIRYLLATIAGPVIILGWLVFYAFSCFALVFFVVAALILTLSYRERLWRRRTCIANCWFIKGSILYRVLHSRLWVTVVAFGTAVFFSAILFLTAVSWSPVQVGIIAADSLLILVLYTGVYHLSARAFGVHQEYRGLFSRGWTVAVNMLLLAAVLLLVQLESPPPDYINDSDDVSETLQAASAAARSQCEWVSLPVQLRQQSEALMWRAVLAGNRAIDDARLRWLLWLFFSDHKYLERLGLRLPLCAAHLLCTQSWNRPCKP